MPGMRTSCSRGKVSARRGVELLEALALGFVAARMFQFLASMQKQHFTA